MSLPSITKVYLLNVPIESDYKHTLYFANAQAQQTYFQSKIVSSYSYNDFTYQRKDKIIRVPAIYDAIYNCNYVMYQNSAYSNKWFYAFIDKIEYINDNRSDIHISTDVIQTWMFDYTIKTSYVEREHTNNDTIGVNTLPEDVELGEPICNSHNTDYHMDELLHDLRYVLALSFDYGEIDNPGTLHFPGGKYNGIYSGCKYYGLDTASEIGVWLHAIDSAGKKDGIASIFMAPTWLSPKIENSFEIKESDNPSTYSIVQSKPSTLNGYTPRNKKLLTYPYTYMIASNNQGGDVIYHYEKFSTSTCNFSVKGCLTVGCSIRLTPTYYNGATNNESEGINLGKFPTCSWTNDAYINWLTQNSVNIASGFISSGANVVGGIGLMTTGAGAMAGAGMVASGLMGITNSVGEIYKHSLIPPQTSGNLNSGDVNTASGNNTFHFYGMSIKAEYCRVIDGYFDMFGYKTNRVKVPNKNHRARWWYTKTIDINIDGAIPNEDMQKIKDCYNNGITFWRNASEIQNYSLSNGII